jgi:hypothetical protein
MYVKVCNEEITPFHNVGQAAASSHVVLGILFGALGAPFSRPARTRGDCAPGSYGGGKLETGKGRGLIAGHVIGLRRIGAAVNRCVTRTLGL